MTTLTKTRQRLSQANLEGIGLWSAGEHEAALKHFLAIRSFYDDSEPLYLRFYHCNLGLIYRALDRLDLAVDEYLIALGIPITEERETGDIASINANLAYALLHLKRYDEAHLFLTDAANYFEGISDSANLGEVLETRALIFLAQNNPDEAVEAAQKAFDLLRGYSDGDAVRRAHRTLGLCLDAQGVKR
jgi:tetratricopeptide (TPR) repeat protein